MFQPPPPPSHPARGWRLSVPQGSVCSAHRPRRAPPRRARPRRAHAGLQLPPAVREPAPGCCSRQTNPHFTTRKRTRHPPSCPRSRGSGALGSNNSPAGTHGTAQTGSFPDTTRPTCSRTWPRTRPLTAVQASFPPAPPNGCTAAAGQDQPATPTLQPPRPDAGPRRGRPLRASRGSHRRCRSGRGELLLATSRLSELPLRPSQSEGCS